MNDTRTEVAPPVQSSDSVRPLVLLVDGDATVRSLAENQLGAAGFDVVAIAEGGPATATFLNLRPDAVILDVLLPDADGLDVCRILRRIPEAQHLPIVMLVSQNDKGAIRTAFEAGATEFFAKPVNWLYEGYRLRYLLRAAASFRQLQKELLHSQKMETLGLLTAGVAHDFNNLLQGVLGWAEMLSMESPTQAELHDGLAQMMGLAEKGRALTRRLLFTSRKSDGKKKAVAVGPLIGEVQGLLAHTLPKTITIETGIPDGLWMINADDSHLHQALMNLALNAVHAMPDGGCLRLHAANVTLDDSYVHEHPEASAGPHVMLEVSGTGAGTGRGVPAPGHDPSVATEATGEGAALSLSIVFGIVRDHGGHLWCNPDAGYGATFRIHLPALPGQQVLQVGQTAGKAQDRPTTQVTPSGEGKTVLVAEDEPLILDLLVCLLEHERYRVVQTCNGKEALEYYLAHRDQVDAIVLDMNMPVMGGETCLQELIRNGCVAPVFLAAGALLPAERQAEIVKLVAGFVMKPYLGRELTDALGRALAPPRAPATAKPLH